jgi:hypothetical protein
LAIAEPEDKSGSRRLSLTKTQRLTEAGAELLSLCQTATADGSLSDEEIASLREWLAANGDSDLPAITYLATICDRILADGVVSAAERRDLFVAIEKILPQDVREMSRTARTLREKAERSKEKAASLATKAVERENRERSRPVEHFDFMVAGAKYDGRPKLIANHVRVPDAVRLVRDPSNRFSRNAVRVVTASGHEVGFVPEEDASELAPLMDSSHPHSARIKKILTGSTHAIPVVVADFFLPGTSVPSTKPPSAHEKSRPPKRDRVTMAPWLYMLAGFVVVVAGVRACAG